MSLVKKGSKSQSQSLTGVHYQFSRMCIRKTFKQKFLQGVQGGYWPRFFKKHPPGYQRHFKRKFSLTTLILLICFIAPTFIKSAKKAPVSMLNSAMKWRCIGPFRGGRVTAVAGHRQFPFTYYMGTAGGGLWITKDCGHTWENISDGFFQTASVGDIAISESAPNIIYVGMGESPIRANTTTHGDGVYKSIDSGRTWTHLGLKKTRHIPTVRVHPQNSDIIFVAAMGNPYAKTKERGIYRSRDGGKTWESVLYVNDTTGAIDLSMDVTNPGILYTAFWDFLRTPWQLRSGGEGSGIYKSNDGGDSWEKLEKGLPPLMGKIGIAVSPANSDRVWAVIEAKKPGLYRSDNGGKDWRLICSDRRIYTRSWYYMHIYADPCHEDTVYVLNSSFRKSTDGGKTFIRIPVLHSDTHDLWINPENNKVMIIGTDGGASISFDTGKTWSRQDNQPTAQFYRVAVDNRFPYRVYGGQQDQGTVAIASRSNNRGIGHEEWYSVGGAENSHIAFNMNDPQRIYATGGRLSEYHHKEKWIRNITAWPQLDLAINGIDLRYRFNWNAPLLMSLHDPKVIYHAAQMILMSPDGGKTWKEISPDLTRNEKDKLGPGGVPFTNEGAGGELYNTIQYIAQSLHEKGVLWAGTDDGRLHLTRDCGKTWHNVTPPGIGRGQINCIEVSPFHEGSAYIAVMNYKLNVFSPFIYKTENYGKDWEKIIDGIPHDTFVRVVREDPGRRGLLYAGTEAGIWISLNDGNNWQSLQLNLPKTPITDLAIAQDDLIAATQGRGFWILDDLTPLHQMNSEIVNRDFFLFKPRITFLTKWGRSRSNKLRGENPPNGVVIFYYLKKEKKEVPVKLEILDEQHQVIRNFTQDDKRDILQMKEGMNRFIWDLRGKNKEKVEDVFFFMGWKGYRVGPGEYFVRLTINDNKMIQSFRVEPDPRLGLTRPYEGYKKQQKTLAEIYGMLNQLHRLVTRLKRIRNQIQCTLKSVELRDDSNEIKKVGNELLKQIDNCEAKLIQPKQQTMQDVINYRSGINIQMCYLAELLEEAGSLEVNNVAPRLKDLNVKWKQYQLEIIKIIDDQVGKFNSFLQEKSIPHVF